MRRQSTPNERPMSAPPVHHQSRKLPPPLTPASDRFLLNASPRRSIDARSSPGTGRHFMEPFHSGLPTFNTFTNMSIASSVPTSSHTTAFTNAGTVTVGPSTQPDYIPLNVCGSPSMSQAEMVNRYYRSPDRGHGKPTSHKKVNVVVDLQNVKEQVLKYAQAQEGKRKNNEMVKKKIQSLAMIGAQRNQHYMNKKKREIIPGKESLIPPVRVKGHSSKTKQSTGATLTTVSSNNESLAQQQHSETVNTSLTSGTASDKSVGKLSVSSPVSDITMETDTTTSSNIVTTTTPELLTAPSTSCVDVFVNNLSVPVTNVSFTTSTNVPSTSLTSVPSTPFANVPSTSLTNIPSSANASLTNVPSTSLTNIPSSANVPSTSLTNVPSNSSADVGNVPSTNVSFVLCTNAPSTPLTNVPFTSLTNVPFTSLTNVPSTSLTNVPSTPPTNASFTPPTNALPTPLTNINVISTSVITSSSLPVITTSALSSATHSSSYRKRSSSPPSLPDSKKQKTNNISEHIKTIVTPTTDSLIKTNELVQKLLEDAKTLGNINLVPSAAVDSNVPLTPSSPFKAVVDNKYIPPPEAMPPKIFCCFKKQNGQECMKLILDGHRLCQEHTKTTSTLKDSLKNSPSTCPSQISQDNKFSSNSNPSTSSSQPSPVALSPVATVSNGNQSLVSTAEPNQFSAVVRDSSLSPSNQTIAVESISRNTSISTNNLQSILSELNTKEQNLQSLLMEAEIKIVKLNEERGKVELELLSYDNELESLQQSLQMNLKQYNDNLGQINILSIKLQGDIDSIVSHEYKTDMEHNEQQETQQLDPSLIHNNTEIILNLGTLNKEQDKLLFESLEIHNKLSTASNTRDEVQTKLNEINKKIADLYQTCEEHTELYQQILNKKQSLLFSQFANKKGSKYASFQIKSNRSFSLSSDTSASLNEQMEFGEPPALIDITDVEDEQMDTTAASAHQEEPKNGSNTDTMSTVENKKSLKSKASPPVTKSSGSDVLIFDMENCAQNVLLKVEKKTDNTSDGKPTTSHQCHEISSSDQSQAGPLPDIFNFEPHSNSVLAMRLSGNELYTCSSDKTTKAYDVKTGKVYKRFLSHQKSVTCLELYKDAEGVKYLLSGSSDHYVHMQNAKTGKIVGKFCCSTRIMFLSVYEHFLYVAQHSGKIAIINLQNKRLIGKHSCHSSDKAISCITSTPNYLFTASFDYTVTCWDINKLYETNKLEGNLMRLKVISSFNNTVLCLLINNDLLFCGSADKSLQVFNIKTWACVHNIKCHNGAISSIQIMGKLLVTACFDKLVRCFDLDRFELIQVYGGQNDMIFSLVANNGIIYTGCRDGAVTRIKLNLTVFYECKWLGCSLRFGVLNHLHEHLKSHCSSNSNIVQCLWDNCNSKVTSTSIFKHLMSHL